MKRKAGICEEKNEERVAPVLQAVDRDEEVNAMHRKWFRENKHLDPLEIYVKYYSQYLA
jgi:hypothetical protein